ncbi:MAG: hypothetical protein WD690_05670 [Vicinamibacterales bacterium]
MPFAERFTRHATERRLLAIIAGEPATPHVSSCAACQARLAGLRSWTDGNAADAGALADETFTEERLAAQKAAILRRLEIAGRSARVIAFPLGITAPVRNTRQVLRWASAAACAGILVGLASGRLLDPHTAGGPVASLAPASARPASPARDTDALNEAALLDAAYDRVAIDALQAIDDLTPRAREVARVSLPRSRR